MTTHFTTAHETLADLVDEPLTIEITKSPRSTRGDVQTIAQIENLETANEERFDTEQHTIRIENDDGAYYAEVLIHLFETEPIALIDWITVVDEEHRGYGIGRTLHKEAVAYIEQTTHAERIYTKIQNQRMKTVNTETGFEKVRGTPGNWYRKR